MEGRLSDIRERCVPISATGEQKRPLAIDLYCGGGGVGMGLFMAGFDVIGYDIKDQPEYPFEFVHASALDADLTDAEFVWASPPCQSFTGIIPTSQRERYGHNWNHENLIPPTREKLQSSGKMYVIENVQGAVSELINPVMLCGTMFPKLKVFRHRLFESSFGLEVMDQKCDHRGRSLGNRSPHGSPAEIEPLDADAPTLQIHIGTCNGYWTKVSKVRQSGKSAGTTDIYYFSPAGKKYRSIGEIERDLRRRIEIVEDDQQPKSNARPNYERPGISSSVVEMFPVYGQPGRHRGTVAQWSDAMQIDWLSTGKPIAQAIPPPYSEFIGRQALQKLGYTLDYEPVSY